MNKTPCVAAFFLTLLAATKKSPAMYHVIYYITMEKNHKWKEEWDGEYCKIAISSHTIHPHHTLNSMIITVIIF